MIIMTEPAQFKQQIQLVACFKQAFEVNLLLSVKPSKCHI